MKLVSKKTGETINLGDTIEDFRGDKQTIMAFYPPGTPGGGLNGKVGVKDEDGHDGTFYASVIGAEYKP